MSQPLLKAEIQSYPHVKIHGDGMPYIAGMTMKVVELVEANQAYGWSPEGLHLQFPHLGLVKIHTALACYCVIKPNSTPRLKVVSPMARRHAWQTDPPRSPPRYAPLDSRLEFQVLAEALRAGLASIYNGALVQVFLAGEQRKALWTTTSRGA
jgi:uncharacterized protein (DUF433 family)